MTARRRLAPRHLFVIAGLSIVALTFACDRHLFSEGPLRFASDFGFGPQVIDVAHEPADPFDSPTEAVEGVQEMRRSLEKLQIARSTFHDAVASDEVDQPLWDQATPEELAAYWERRDAAWPAYAAEVEGCLEAARRTRSLDPNNGVFEVMEGLLELNLAIKPCPFDPVTWHDDDEKIARDLRVVDPERLEHALQTIERGLERSDYSWRSGEVAAGRIAAVQGRSLEGMAKRFTAGATLMLPELMLTKGGVDTLITLARSERQDGRDPMRTLKLGRKIALRTGAQSTTLIELLVADAELRMVDDAWVREAAHLGDAEGAHAAASELLAARQRRSDARSLRGVNIQRLGTLDSLMMPAGGWGKNGDLSTGRRMDYALLESSILWSLILGAGLLLLIAGFNARRARPESAPAAQGWTLGDLLAVVLPSFGAAAVLTLLYYRLHPTSALGLGVTIDAVAIQVPCLVFGALFTHRYLLRGRVLAKHGMTWRRPRAAKASAWCVGAATLGALFWTGPYADDGVGVLWTLLGLATVLGFVGGVFGRGVLPKGPARQSVLRLSGRIGLACAGAALCLLGAAETVLVAPRREALIERSAQLSLDRFQHEGHNWGGGKPLEAFKDTWAEAPDAPVSPK